MPLCRLLTRLPLHNRLPSTALRSRIPPARWQRSYSTALDESRNDERPPPQELDLSKISADSAFLDFILGPSNAAPKDDGGIGDGWDEEAGRVAPRSNAASGLSSLKTRRARTRRPIPVGPEQPARHQNGLDGDTQLPRGAKQPDSTTLVDGRLPAPALTSRQNDLRRSAALAKQGIRMRTKWISMKSPDSRATFFSSFWNMEMAKLQRRYNKKFKMYYLAKRRVPSLSEEASTWANTALENVQAEKTAVLAGLADEATPRMTSLRRWQQASLWLLHHQPERVADFLRFSHAAPYPPSQCIADLLEYLAVHFAHDNSASKSGSLQALAEVLPALAHRGDRARLSLDSSFFAHVMPHCTDYQVNLLYQAIKQHHIFVLAHTYLHFATYFSRNERFDQALDALLLAKNARVDLNSFEFRSNCSTLLRNAIRHPDGLRMCLRIVDNLVKMGLTLNNHISNIVMLNAVEAGDLNTAFNIYHSLTQHGLEADEYTYGILLKACKTNIDDAETLNQTIRSAIEHGHVLGNPVVATEILHCLALHHTKHNPERAFETVADAYAQLFDMEPMHKLGLSPRNISKSSSEQQEKMPPSPHAIGIMIATFLEHTYRASESTQPAYDLYKRYCLLADAHVEPFSRLLQHDYIPNSFLKTFIKTRKGLLYATEVIKYMQKPSDPDAPVERCKPTVQTWSIFLHGFTRHRQIGMAEQILTYMRGKGIEPNDVTWNTLAAGYASVQNIEGTLDVLRRMEADGGTWDQWTVKGLRRLRDQERFKHEWEKSRQAVQLDFTSDLKEDLGTRIAVFGEEEVRVEQREGVGGVADSPGDLAESEQAANAYKPF